MKRGKTLLFVLLFVLLVSLVFGQSPGIVNNASDTLKGVASDAKSVTSSIFDMPVPIPPELRFLARIILYIQSGAENISLRQLVFVGAFSVLFFIILLQIMEFTMFKKSTSFVISICLTVVLLITGVLGRVSEFVLGWMTAKSFMGWVWFLLAMIVVIFLIGFMSRFYKKQEKLSKADELGTKAGASLKGLSKASDKAVEAAE